MPFLSDMSSAVKSRFRFHDQSSDSMPPVPSTPLLFKSASKESLSEISAIRNTAHRDNHSVAPPNQKFELSEDPSFWKDHNIQVIIRTRPLSSSEISQQGHSKCVRQDSCQTLTWTGHPESRFTFDLVADEHVSQEMLFKVAGVPMVENCIGGYNSCMFAYGQTGSGKTHTMLGDIENGIRRHNVNCGITPRVFEYLFTRIQKEKEVRQEENLKYTCKCSFLEIYNEQILDLLEPNANNLQIREDIKKGVYVDSLTEVAVTSANDVMQQLLQGSANRKVAATNMNRASSRSHSVFTCNIESQWESQGVIHHRFARLNLVDLAGSERQKSSGAEGERLKEATNINKSLSTLGLVIMNLVSVSNGKSQHIPYRDSKLTFLLQDSLGGNSKTTIIANISPSVCCSLETLSTLKFAQRAKFMKNHAIVNEDASGDVLAMRTQIQQLKKEVSRLRGLTNGAAEKDDNETLAVSFPGSPGAFNWEGLNSSSSPLVADKRLSQRKEYEVALVGAFRREKDKGIALQSMAAENEASKQLAKRREDEIQGLKMRLGFRQAEIKRLEAVASGKISAETHLLKEKEEHLKEIEVLRSQVDRNQEVTRFAMENLRLKEEIRRLKSFYEEGERERMNEQIVILQNKLLEALDWKLMHESDPLILKKGCSEIASIHGKGNLLSGLEQESSWQTSINEENEFLRVQAIQNQSEMDALRKRLNFCTEEKDKLQRNVKEIMEELEGLRSAKSQKENAEFITSSTTANSEEPQIELQTMVSAIAAASQREAEAHETAIVLSKENEELRMKLKVLLEDNNKLIDLYERAASESSYRNNKNDNNLINHNVEIIGLEKQQAEMTKQVENLNQQLMEMHEENDKLMGLYEKAMQDCDEFKRLILSLEENQRTHCPEFDPMETDSACLDVENEIIEAEVMEPLNLVTVQVSEDMEFVRMKLDSAEQKLIDSAKSLTQFGSLEKYVIKADNLSKAIKQAENNARNKGEEFIIHNHLCNSMQEKGSLILKKLTALKCSTSSFSSSIYYFEQREVQGISRVTAASSFVNSKREELAFLQAGKDEIETSLKRHQEAESEIVNHLLPNLKMKMEEENRRREDEKVLFEIDNLENQRNWQFSGKATELLKSEEEKTRLQMKMKQTRDKLGNLRKQTEELSNNVRKVENQMAVVEREIEKGSKTLKEMEEKLKTIVHEKEMLLEMNAEGAKQREEMIVSYFGHCLEAETKEVERMVLEEELKEEEEKIKELQAEKRTTMEEMSKLVEIRSCNSCLEGLYDARASVMELKSFICSKE
ncbi:kinesin-like protein KIN-12E [Impatiens glandulifera]|uniref:kinesin-like protein KIN-12E n=1 Tax=Impatiens glandulifera TaxID=253017 RepID=UPI001FB06C6D|nr:kinesin-like protein KIN-12E [Impatiens glandulifera]